MMQSMSTQAAQNVPAGWYPDAAGVLRWWDGYRWTEHTHTPQYAVTQYAPAQQIVVQQKRVNHVLHLLLTIVTLGLWLPVWIILALANS